MNDRTIAVSGKTLLAITVASALSATAHAQTPASAEEIQQLQRQLQALEARLEALSAGPAASTAGATGTTVTDNGRSVTTRSADGSFSFQLGGRLQLDAATYNADNNDFGDGTKVRRLFLDARGTFADDWSYRIQYDLARNSASDPASRGVRDAWIQYSGFGPHLITIGSFKEPFGLERITGNLDTTFIERAVTDLFSPDRHLGIGYSRSTDRWSFSAGLFGDTPEGDAPNEGNEGRDITARFTYTPIRSAGSLVHLGIAGRLHEPRDSTSGLRFRERPESNITDIRLVDTGVLTDVDDFHSIGLEFAAISGRGSVQSEYVTTRVNRDAGQGNLDFDSWYAYASWFLTNDSRAYAGANGSFGRVSPSSDNGAWEVALRYSNLDLTDGNVIGGEQDNITLGLNWYATSNLGFSANYTHLVKLDRPGSAYDDEELDALTVRAQFDF